MTTPTLDTLTTQFLTFLHRGGTVDYTWAVRGQEKTSFWRTIGQGEPTLLNSRHNMYFGVHPCTAIPPTNSKGKQVAPKHVRSQITYIAAINCLFGEFDAKRWVPVTDEEARGELEATGKGTLAEARSRVQERGFLKDPEPYKAQALAHIQALDCQPSVIIDSGGGFHTYWLLAEPYLITDDDRRRRAKRVQYAWVDKVHSDDDAKDLARVLRIPGTQNFKPGYAPNYPTVHFVHADFQRLYTFEELQAYLPPEPVKTEKTRPTRQPTEPVFQDETGNAADFDAISRAASCLKRLNPARRDSYNDWVNVGMCLAELGAIGYNLWDLWSKGSAKYKPGDCADKWPTFHAAATTDDLSLKSLERWANEDDPDGGLSLSPEKERQLAEYKKEESIRIDVLRNKALGDREKVAWLAMRTTVELKEQLQKAGAVPLTGEEVGRLMGRADSTGNRAIRGLEEHGVLVCDPVPFTTKEGHPTTWMHVRIGPAYDDPTQVLPATSKTARGGKRAGAGRKPKCAECPPDTRIIKKTEVTYWCEGCGQQIDAEPAKFDTIAPDAEINIDFTEVTATTSGAAAAEIKSASKEEDGYLACNSEFTQTDEHAASEIKIDFRDQSPVAVPAIIEETMDLTAAIRCADTFSPESGIERQSYKTALSWLHKGEPERAWSLCEKLPDPVHRAILGHLIARLILPETSAPRLTDNGHLHTPPGDMNSDYRCRAAAGGAA